MSITTEKVNLKMVFTFDKINLDLLAYHQELVANTLEEGVANGLRKLSPKEVFIHCQTARMAVLDYLHEQMQSKSKK